MEAHSDPRVTNIMNPITHECISLGPKGNIQVTQNLLCLDTGRVLKIINIIIMVAPDQVIRKVNYWCKKSKIEQHRKILESLKITKEPSYWNNEELK